MQALAPDGKLQETEFQYHKQCYWNYVYNYIYADKNLTSEIKTDAKFDEVVKFVKKSLIDYEKTWSWSSPYWDIWQVSKR